MQHILAYTISSAGGLTNQDIPAVQDGFATVQNGHYILQNPWYLRWAMGLGLNMLNGRINAPPLRIPSIPSLGAVDTAASPTSLPAIIDYPGFQIRIPPIDEIAFEATDAAVAGRLYGFLGIQDVPNNNIPPGRPTTLRATAANTGGANVWTAAGMTFDQGLEAGRYAIVGIDVVGANLLAARLVFPNQTARPGCIARTAVTNKPDPMFRGGRAGVLGEFESTAAPQLDVFPGPGAATTQTVFLDVIKIR